RAQDGAVAAPAGGRPGTAGRLAGRAPQTSPVVPQHPGRSARHRAGGAAASRDDGPGGHRGRARRAVAAPGRAVRGLRVLPGQHEPGDPCGDLRAGLNGARALTFRPGNFSCRSTRPLRPSRSGRVAVDNVIYLVDSYVSENTLMTVPHRIDRHPRRLDGWGAAERIPPDE